MPPGSIIGGGAVRDWFLGVEPKDIDVFIDARRGEAPPECSSLAGDRDEEYEAMREVVCVQRGILEDRVVDVVHLDLIVRDGGLVLAGEVDPKPFTAENVIELFDFGITRCAYDGAIRDSTHASIDRANFTVTLFRHDRLERAMRRFERFTNRHNGVYTLVAPTGDIIR